jgi:hypothetical protein
MHNIIYFTKEKPITISFFENVIDLRKVKKVKINMEIAVPKFNQLGILK